MFGPQTNSLAPTGHAQAMCEGRPAAAGPQPGAAADAPAAQQPAWFSHMEIIFEQRGQQMEGLFGKHGQRTTMPEDALQSMAWRTQCKMQSLEKMFKTKLTTLDEAQNQRRDQDLTRLEVKISRIAAEKRGGDGGQTSSTSDKIAAGWHDPRLQRQSQPGRDRAAQKGPF